jgi:hypothetical protein
MLRVFSRAACVALVLALGAPAIASADLSIYISRSSDQRSTYLFIGSFSGPNPGSSTFTVERGGGVIGVQDPNARPVRVCCSGLALLAGDVIRVTAPETFTFTFDGRPAFDPSVCGTASTFSGLRSNPRTQVNDVFGRVPNGDPYSSGSYIDGFIETLLGESFSGSFARALAPTDLVVAETRQRIGDVDVYSSYERVVGDCPPPVARPLPTPAPSATPVAIARDTTAPTGHLSTKKLAGGLKALLAGKARTSVIVGEPDATVTESVYLDNGARLPASAAAKKATLVARGSAVSTKAGTVTVKLKPTAAARKLKGKRSAKLAIVTTLRDAAGNVSAPAVTKLTVKET